MTQHDGATSSCANVSQLSLTTLGSLQTKNMYTKNTHSNHHTKKESSTPHHPSNKHNESTMTQESLIWLKYNVICEGQKVQLVKAAHVHTQEMMKIMGQTHCSSEHYTKLYLCALSSLAEEYAEWKASSQPSIHTKSPPSKSHKSKEEVSLPLKIKVNAHKSETPSHQDI